MGSPPESVRDIAQRLQCVVEKPTCFVSVQTRESSVHTPEQCIMVSTFIPILMDNLQTISSSKVDRAQRHHRYRGKIHTHGDGEPHERI